MGSLTGPIRPGERFNVNTIPLYLVDRLVDKFRPQVFIETGTYLGHTVAEVFHLFERVITIELDPKLAADAKERLCEQAIVLQGNSGELLHDVLDEVVKHRALVWLDAHWSKGITAQASSEVHTSIYAELEALRQAPRRDHILMIDDLADFKGLFGYPTLNELLNLVREINPDYVIEMLINVRRGVLVAIPPFLAQPGG